MLPLCYLRPPTVTDKFVVDYNVHRYGGVFLGNRYGAGTGQIWLDGVHCNGIETSITDCGHNGWGIHDCGHNEDVSISCNTSISTKGSQFIMPVVED